MSVVRKVQSRLDQPKASVEVEKESPKKEAVVKSAKREETARGGARPKRVCAFCMNKIQPLYWDAAALRRYISDRGRIYSRQRSGVCAKHQRRLSQEIKRARQLALLPFTVRV